QRDYEQRGAPCCRTRNDDPFRPSLHDYAYPVGPAHRHSRSAVKPRRTRASVVYAQRMTTTPAEAFRLPGISPKAYEHPADRAATAALASIPYMDPVVRKLIALGEKRVRSILLGSSVRLGEDQLPRIWAQHHQAYDVLDIEPLPELYVTQSERVNALTI